MDRDSVQLAAKLLAKAQRTEFDGEAISLVEKSYRLLAGIINTEMDRPDGALARGPRRERRHLRDRRASRRSGATAAAEHRADPAVSYRRLAYELRPDGDGRIDLSA
jgi:hypothetical protein